MRQCFYRGKAGKNDTITDEYNSCYNQLDNCTRIVVWRFVVVHESVKREVLEKYEPRLNIEPIGLKIANTG